ncbi:hypothetical protein ACD591_03120 [Rufibacter glacialis]|uniref:Cupin domain-containing protein n=1 Tax=Rufibacter glacialis TaxID=1259555 RepID=A0A5M8QIL7_9BACT|nr:hypothetical protein [Rufibacter glacialis]KAA6435869.1 hypothetical protein FOE74_08015 [Rufibacter glacialis]GGK67283.1 hypothetical protein GCM10011405_14030 [Rufibacter glacialis]
MKTRFISAFFTICFLVSLAPAFGGTTPSSPASRTSKVFKQVLKTDHLRILSLELKPGEFLDFHASPEQEAYAASDGTLKLVTPDGQEKTIAVKTGDRLWTDLTHFKNWNAGEKTLKIMVLEQPRQVEEKKSYFSFLSSKP